MVLVPSTFPVYLSAYWGKARPETGGDSPSYHLLAYHALDVAAVAEALSHLPAFELSGLAQELDWDLSSVRQLNTFFSALHDLGKFARAFQGLAPHLSPTLVPPIASKQYRSCRHDTMGWLLWKDHLSLNFPEGILGNPGSGFWAAWIKAVAGHHGSPPMETARNGWSELSAEDYFHADDVAAAHQFVAAAAQLIRVRDMPAPTRNMIPILKRHAWRLAGMTVLADWLGSDQRFFRYHDEPMPLDRYWAEVAQPNAREALAAAGLGPAPVRQWNRPADLFGYLDTPTPLQRLAAELPLGPGPELFLLEDVTGAGKTEAALMLTYRLMAAGKAQGFYFGLPTMATSNQMYARVGSVYRSLYEPGASPSLVLSHGARQMIDAFRESVLVPGQPVTDLDYSPGEGSATAQCSAWLADNRKKALLAHVGVGTLDQALLAVLPVRHQSLRLTGLAGKVLVADEVHAYDPYMRTLLARLLQAHASQGGSAALLSATLPADMRRELVQAFMRGRGADAGDVPDDGRYPLVTHAHARVQTYPCDTRPEVKRTVKVQWLHDEAEVQRLVLAQAQAGRSVCWIRNTVGDARRAYEGLQKEGASHVALFHSRYAMGDRLAIEDKVLATYGKKSSAEQRAGRILVSTQVVEQSLDLDFDVLISDLAPIDLLIQRAGRLHRHRRDVQGNPAGHEGREAPVLYIFGPRPDMAPRADWYKAVLPGANAVYPNTGRLWLTQQVLCAAGEIVSPGEPGQLGAVRTLVEGVYGVDAQEIPDALLQASSRQEGEAMAHISQANFNALEIERGYSNDSNRQWHEDTVVPTRLSDEDSVVVYLARISEDGLLPWFDGGALGWELSSLRVQARLISGLSPALDARFREPLAELRAARKLLEEPALIVPLARDSLHAASAEIMDSDGGARIVRYDAVTGWAVDA